MKRIIALMLALVLALGLVACAADGDADESTESTGATEESEGNNLDRTALPYREELSDADKYLIEKAWNAEKDETVIWFDEYADVLNNEATRYYGVFGNDYIVLFVHVGWNIEFGCSYDIAGESFSHSEMFEIYGYKDGIFYGLSTLYENGEISLPEVMIIADIHAKFEQYIKTYS